MGVYRGVAALAGGCQATGSTYMYLGPTSVDRSLGCRRFKLSGIIVGRSRVTHTGPGLASKAARSVDLCSVCKLVCSRRQSEIAVADGCKQSVCLELQVRVQGLVKYGLMRTVLVTNDVDTTLAAGLSTKGSV